MSSRLRWVNARVARPVRPIEVVVGETAAAPSEPAKDGYTFEGWYTAASGGDVWDFTTDVVAGDMTLFARFAAVPEPAEPAADLTLDVLLGEPVAGGGAAYEASGLQVGTAWTLTLRSTPQIIAQGVVSSTGAISGLATIPSGLAAGWHSITLDSTDNTGAALTRVVYFEIGAAGELVSSNDTGIPDDERDEAELAATGLADDTIALGALTLILAGVLVCAIVPATRSNSRRRTASP